jgi:hypothetical protein
MLSSDRVVRDQSAGYARYDVVRRPSYVDEFCVSAVEQRYGSRSIEAVYLRTSVVECNAIAEAFDERSTSLEPFGDRADALYCWDRTGPHECERAVLWLADIGRRYRAEGLAVVGGLPRHQAALDMFFSEQGRLRVGAVHGFGDRSPTNVDGFFTRRFEGGFVHVRLSQFDGQVQVLRVESAGVP